MTHPNDDAARLAAYIAQTIRDDIKGIYTSSKQQRWEEWIAQAIRDAQRQAADCCKWEADTQRAHLEQYGLAEEFPYGCDSIGAVADTLVTARNQVAVLVEAVLGYAPHKSTVEEKLSFIKFCVDRDTGIHRDANTGLLERLYKLLSNLTEAAKAWEAKVRAEGAREERAEIAEYVSRYRCGADLSDICRAVNVPWWRKQQLQALAPSDTGRVG